MEDNYGCKPESPTMGKESTTDADMPPALKADITTPPLDTSSQASVEEMEASPESNLIYASPIVMASSSHRDSPLIDLMELQSDANQAANYMLSVKRSSDLKRQWVIQDFKASL